MGTGWPAGSDLGASHARSARPRRGCKGSANALRAGNLGRCTSACARSGPCRRALAWVMKGCINVTWAPACSNRRAACSTSGALVLRPAGPHSVQRSRPRRAAQALRPCPRQWLVGQAHAVARIWLQHHRKHQRGVSARVRVMEACCAAGCRGGSIGMRQAGFEAEDAAPAGGRAERTANVGANVQGLRTSAAAPAPALEPPGPLSRPHGLREGVKARQARGQHAVVGHGGLGHHHGPCLAQAGGGRGISGCRHQQLRRCPAVGECPGWRCFP